MLLPLVSLLSKLFERLCRLESKFEVYLIMRYSVKGKVKIAGAGVNVNRSGNNNWLYANRIHL